MKKSNLPKVFIVHGHDKRILKSVRNFVKKLHFQPIVLHEQPSKGLTIIEKFMDYSKGIDFVIVIFTPDDVGAQRTRKHDLKARPRQNVVFELGFFIGKLGREKVCVLYKQSKDYDLLSEFSDYKGVNYIPIGKTGRWRLQLAKELPSLKKSVKGKK